jgi:hypothetical protein
MVVYICPLRAGLKASSLRPSNVEDPEIIVKHPYSS